MKSVPSLYSFRYLSAPLIMHATKQSEFGFRIPAFSLINIIAWIEELKSKLIPFECVLPMKTLK